MRLKTIIVDLDRTLLRTDKTISEYTALILRQCKAHGIRIMLATARPLRAIKQYCEIVEFDAMVVSNGARVISNNQWKEYGICIESARHVLAQLQNNPTCRITLETGDIAYSNKVIGDYETIICNDLESVVENEGALKIIVSFDDEKILKFVESVLTEDLYCTVANGHLLQIMDKRATKWNGIQAMLQLTESTEEEAIYFGDDYDDIEPIKRCGVGVAVSNGIDEVKAVADYIALSNDEDGVAGFIEKHLGVN